MEGRHRRQRVSAECKIREQRWREDLRNGSVPAAVYGSQGLCAGAGTEKLSDFRSLCRIEPWLWYALEQPGHRRGHLRKELYRVDRPFHETDGLLADRCGRTEADRENYTAVTGRTDVPGVDRMGLWQCKLRYCTREEVLSVARQYQKEGIKIDQIVIDFFHWTVQGDWKFDKTYWPDPRAMVEELHSMGIKVIVSVWPSVDRRSENSC